MFAAPGVLDEGDRGGATSPAVAAARPGVEPADQLGLGLEQVREKITGEAIGLGPVVQAVHPAVEVPPMPALQTPMKQRKDEHRERARFHDTALPKRVGDLDQLVDLQPGTPILLGRLRGQTPHVGRAQPERTGRLFEESLLRTAKLGIGGLPQPPLESRRRMFDLPAHAFCPVASRRT